MTDQNQNSIYDTTKYFIGARTKACALTLQAMLDWWGVSIVVGSDWGPAPNPGHFANVRAVMLADWSWGATVGWFWVSTTV